MSEHQTLPYYVEDSQKAWRNITLAVDGARAWSMPIRLNDSQTSMQSLLWAKEDLWHQRVAALETFVQHPKLHITEFSQGKVIAQIEDTVFSTDRDAFYNVLIYGRSQVSKLPIDHDDVLQGAYEDFMYVDALASHAHSYGADGVIYQMRFFDAVRADGSRSDASMPAVYWYGSMGIEQYVRTMLTDPDPSDVDLASIGLTKNMYSNLVRSGVDVVEYVLQPWIQRNVLRKAYV